MATKKSTPAKKSSITKKVAKPPKGMAPNELADPAGEEPETVLVPVLAQPYMKAPATDPYLRAGTVTAEHVTVCGYQLPPILRGIQPCVGQDYDVKVIWMSRRQIETMMARVRSEYPELSQMLEIMKAFLCHLDTLRDESKLGILASLGFMKEHMPADSPAFNNLSNVVKMLGRWNDENRLPLY